MDFQDFAIGDAVGDAVDEMGSDLFDLDYSGVYWQCDQESFRRSYVWKQFIFVTRQCLCLSYDIPKFLIGVATRPSIYIVSSWKSVLISEDFKRTRKVILGTKFKRCVKCHELRATDCYFLGGFVPSNLSKPCAIPSISFLFSGSAQPAFQAF